MWWLCKKFAENCFLLRSYFTKRQHSNFEIYEEFLLCLKYVFHFKLLWNCKPKPLYLIAQLKDVACKEKINSITRCFISYASILSYESEYKPHYLPLNLEGWISFSSKKPEKSIDQGRQLKQFKLIVEILLQGYFCLVPKPEE